MTPERFSRLRTALSRRQPDLTVLMERVHKDHNLSAILRNCDAAGVLEAHAIPGEPRVRPRRGSSAGALDWVPVHDHVDTASAFEHLRARGFTIVAAHPDEGAVDYRSYDFTRPTAILMGAELFGVSEEALAAADHHLVIPMEGLVRSLNVSVATALLLFEARAQRERAGLYDASRLDPEDFRRRLFEWCWPKEARRLRAAGVPYPDLDEDGEWIERPEI